MGQRISSSRLTSLVSPNQHPAPCTHPHPRRFSLGSLEDTQSRSRSSLRGHTENSRQAYLCTHTALYTRTLQRSKSQDREPSRSTMTSQQPCSCNNLCAQCGNSTLSSRQLLEDVQNGNTVDANTSTNICVKSSSIERYMSAITERMEQTLLGNSECKCCVQPSTSASNTSNSNNCVCSGAYKTRTKGRSKLVSSKSCSKQLDRASATQDCFSCVRDGPKERIAGKTSLKKKRWVPKFYGSKLTKNGAKISVNGTGGSTDSGLDIAGSTNDPSCVCTLYRKMDDACRVMQNNPDSGLSNNAQTTSSGRGICVRAGAASSIRHECEGARCNANRSSNADLPTLSLANLPINITVSRVGQPVYSAFLTTASSNNPNVYGTLGHDGTTNIYGTLVANDGHSILLSVATQNTPLIDLRLSAEEYPVEDCEERARVIRAWEIAEGVDPAPGYRPHPHIQVLSTSELRTLFLQRQSRIHTQVDFIHCLVPDLKAINQCSFYWGKMDRYEAERLLEGKPEGTFLLRDSAQEDYLFSVSFRKYGRSLHARIEQFNHKFSFDSHDPGVYAASTVTGLIEHYKDPACVMFFEPMLTAPLSRTHAFPLQHLCRAVIASCTTYDGINELRLPQSMKAYLKEYHYRQRVRVKRFEGPPEGFHWAPEEAL